ncbi:hypothetical protein TTHERM_00852930 (macronuclear) [Tetrahymena thermophila SB210]|uniref:Uncharacterized protein n=1 Tax=Tetrahymena thermophila (strain SB210) TaxID=312017 RepID=Q24E47_TETTS|nr:hypothetical protein TTHERM_00852930 [Tetrahymena thermophila SB210]EAS06054.2 hypothetical protein TTHERM_00852930 [Tetrahymena thermophila SB210]|eukprot:XP_001026299.2 hypothetical protein TTHERM_00852930 [Tetrahymena thermophila SB210]
MKEEVKIKEEITDLEVEVAMTIEEDTKIETEEIIRGTRTTGMTTSSIEDKEKDHSTIKKKKKEQLASLQLLKICTIQQLKKNYKNMLVNMVKQFNAKSFGMKMEEAKKRQLFNLKTKKMLKKLLKIQKVLLLKSKLQVLIMHQTTMFIISKKLKKFRSKAKLSTEEDDDLKHKKLSKIKLIEYKKYQLFIFTSFYQCLKKPFLFLNQQTNQFTYQFNQQFLQYFNQISNSKALYQS